MAEEKIFSFSWDLYVGKSGQNDLDPFHKSWIYTYFKCIFKTSQFIDFKIFRVGFLYLIFVGGCLLGGIICLSFLCSLLFHTPPPNRVYQEIPDGDPAARDYLFSGAQVHSASQKHWTNNYAQWILSNKTVSAHIA